MLQKSIFMIPDDVLSSNESQILPLKNPFTSSGSYFLINCSTKSLYEIQGFDEKFRSWFVDGQVHSDGCLRVVTPYNPVFLILPYLIKATKNVPLDHLLQDEEFPHMIKLTEIVDDLSCVADRKGPESLCVWSYNESSTLEWLSTKIDDMCEALKEAKEPPSLTYSLASDKDAYRCLAFSIISENLCEELSAKLRVHLKLPQPDKENLPVSSENPTKKPKIEEQIMNSEEPAKQSKKVVKETAKEKALKKSAQGSKSIMSFFSKK